MMSKLIIIVILLFCNGVTSSRSQLKDATNPSSVAGLTQAREGTVDGYGSVRFLVEKTNQVIYVETTLIVPPMQAHKGTLFVWPGLQPGGANFKPIDNGVLQPVLTWGPSCAPGIQPPNYSSWWVSAQYVNTVGSFKGYTGCKGGRVMTVNPGDQLFMQFKLNGTIWTQTVTNLRTNRAVKFSIGLLGQAQNYVYFIIEQYASTFVDDAVYLNSKWKFAQPSNQGCTLAFRGIKDFVSTPQLSTDRLSCSVVKIIQRAKENPQSSF